MKITIDRLNVGLIYRIENINEFIESTRTIPESTIRRSFAVSVKYDSNAITRVFSGESRHVLIRLSYFHSSRIDRLV